VSKQKPLGRILYPYRKSFCIQIILILDKNQTSWKDWKWQMQNRLTNPLDLKNFIPISVEEEKEFPELENFFSFGVTPYYLSLVDTENRNCPIRLQIVPRKEERIKSPNEVSDPLGEENYMPVKGVTHRYPDRALWYLSHHCAVFCRFCTRKRKVGSSAETPRSEEMDQALQYFQNHTEIKEVILSGGDPLSLSDDRLISILRSLKKISHINQIRIHSRYPVTLPFRITKELCERLSEFFPLFLVTHFNSEKECSEEAREAISNLIRIAHMTVLNQTVLLKNINDSSDKLSKLNYKLTSMGVKPYYLHQCDEVFGSSHFKVPVEEGIAIMKELRGFHSGITIPNYVIDLTGGGGKVPLPTDYLKKTNIESYEFENYKGLTHKIRK
jgi:lysine 2,3-aminomutase